MHSVARTSAWLALLVAALLIGLGLRSIKLSEPHILDFHSWRQGDTAAFTHGYLTETINPLDPSLDRFPCEYRDKPFGRVEAELPVASWLAALPLAVVGMTYPPAPYLRAVSVAFFFGTCIYLFLLVVQLGESRETAAVAVLVFGILPVSAFFTRTVQPDGPALFFCCGFIFHLDRWVGGASRAHALASCVLAALALLQKISGAFMFFPAAYLIVARHGLVASLLQWRFWVWGTGVIAPVAAWYGCATRNPWTFGIWEDKYSSLPQLADLELWRIFSDRAAFEILSWAGIILLGLGFARVVRSRAVRVATVWFGAVVVFIAATLPGNHEHVYYQLPIALPASVVISIAIMDLVRRGWSARMMLIPLAAMHFLITRDILVEYHRPSSGIEDGVALLVRHVPRDSRIVSTDRNPALFYNAGVKAWFTASGDLSVAEQCMADEAEFLLVDAETQGSMDRSERAKNRLQAGFEKKESTPHFTLWKKK